MREAKLEPLVEYPGGAAPWKCVCLGCERIVTPSYGSVRSGQRGCKFCAQVRVDPEAAADVMRDAGLEPMEPYPGQNKAPWRCRCLGCGAIVSPRYNTIQQGTALGCNRCGIERRGLARRIPEDQAVAAMQAAGAEPLEPYPGSMRSWKCKCLSCGREISPTLHNVKASQNPCGYCSGTRVDVQQAIQAMRDAGVEPLEDFPGSDEPWPSQCLRCHRKVAPRYSSIKQGQTGCAYCAGRLVDPAEAVELMREAGVEPQKPWPGSDTDWPCVCLTCNRAISPRYNNVRRGNAPCAYCAGAVVDPVLAIKLMQDKGYEPLEPYPGSGVPWECRHLPCGGIVFPRYSGIRAGYGGCTTCAKYGFTDSEPAYIYLVHSADHRAYKLGISNRGDYRLAEHRRYGWHLCTIDGKACLWPVTEGRIARKIERAIRDWWRLDLTAPPAVGSNDMPQRGYTETISDSFLSAEEIALRVRELIEGF
ncbi:hypothetical protein ACRYCC_35135 [Actinomadura scrupuli]|uniref:hypothetical protein n=1 Tax=Actinomadura scrupuli TaxID=559629 RepID=UPI003D9914FA